MQIRMKAHILVGLLFCLLITSCASGGVRPHNFTLAVSGTVERDLSGGEIYYEDTPVGRHIYIQKNGPGNDICVFDINFPADLPPGEYAVSTDGQGPVVAGFYDTKDGVDGVFITNVSGVLTVEESKDTFRGSLDITAGEPAVVIQGSFDGVPFAKAPAAKEAETAKGSMQKGIVGFAYVLVFVMVLISLAFQFYVGRQIYSGQPFSIFLLLNPTRVYLRGWRDPRLRRVMNGWTIIILGVLMFICLVAAVFEVGK